MVKAKKRQGGKRPPQPRRAPHPGMLTEVSLKGGPQQDLNLWHLKHEAAPLPSLCKSPGPGAWSQVAQNWPGAQPPGTAGAVFEVGGSVQRR